MMDLVGWFFVKVGWASHAFKNIIVNSCASFQYIIYIVRFLCVHVVYHIQIFKVRSYVSQSFPFTIVSHFSVFFLDVYCYM